MRMRNLFGAAKMDATWPDEKTLKLAKMEYAKTIGQFNRDQIHEAFEDVKRSRQSGSERFQWPDVDAILGLLTKEGEITGAWGTAAHRIYEPERLLEDIGARERAHAAGEKTLAGLRGIFG